LFEHLCNDLEKIIREVSEEFGVDISMLHIQQDHVEIMVKFPPVYSAHHFIAQVKRRSAPLRNKCPSIKRRVPSQWNRHYFCNLDRMVDNTGLEQFRSNHLGGSAVIK